MGQVTLRIRDPRLQRAIEGRAAQAHCPLSQLIIELLEVISTLDRIDLELWS